ncbi:hypothetical protein OsI_05633 [Oryza sativa Indica Group]|uniref:CSD domain-containing protein n=1 Tax=Oryza sativa subsp. indica TaxID=39946 RepID=B8AGK8_ORYSI|nr:hypothetical protein OsI_05633 [Oryza sativa Indica Group]
MAAAARHRGTVKWFNDTKGFGFISPDDGSEDLFVHQSSIKADGFRSLAEGEQVEFAISESEDGRTKAVDVTGPDGSFVKGGAGGGGGGGGGFGSRAVGGGVDSRQARRHVFICPTVQLMGSKSEDRQQMQQ